MKVLFVIHGNNLVYGASKSLFEILKNVDYEYDLLVADFRTRSILNKDIENILKQKDIKIFRAKLPYDEFSISDYTLKNIVLLLKTWTRNKYILIRNYFYFQNIFKLGYDIIYLNSFTLYRLISKKYRFVIHIREIVDVNKFKMKKIINQINKSTGIIFIDHSTYEPFSDIEKEFLVINNPFNMTHLKALPIKNKSLGSISFRTNIVYSIIGIIESGKGVEFVIDSFIKADLKRAILLIVGDYENDYGKKCLKLAKDNHNILFLGELKDVSEVYSITDYVVRGEERFAIGRTIYEGLYSGCRVIIPGEKEVDQFKIFENKLFKNSIYFYQPRNIFSLINVFEETLLNKVDNRKLYSNIEEYIQKHTIFLNKLIE